MAGELTKRRGWGSKVVKRWNEGIRGLFRSFGFAIGWFPLPPLASSSHEVSHLLVIRVELDVTKTARLGTLGRTKSNLARIAPVIA